MSISTMKKPSAWIPLVMSFAALALVLGHIAIFGAAREPDEGTAAHIWQILMAAQVPIVAFFAIKWLPRSPKQALLVLALQAGAVLVALAPVFFFNL
jgi:FtsH-binding integral membrane protein